MTQPDRQPSPDIRPPDIQSTAVNEQHTGSANAPAGALAGILVGGWGKWILSVLVLAGAGYAGWDRLYLPWQASQQQLIADVQRLEAAQARQQSSFAELSEALGNARRELAALREETNRLSVTADERYQRAFSSIHDLRKAQGRQRGDWLVSEAEHLMVTASRLLQLNQDVKSARVALQYADDALQTTQDPVWLPVRQQLAREMESLVRAVQPDRAGLAFRLRVLAESLERLPLAPIPEALAGHVQTSGEGSWREKAAQLISALVIVSRTAGSEPELLEPRQQYYLVENMKLLLRVAEVSVERSDQEAYRRHLQQVSDWLRRYYQGTPAVDTTLGELHALEQENITAELPDLSGSRQRLRQILRGSRESE